MYDLMFANQELENRFRRSVDSVKEIGGFLFCKYGFSAMANARELRRLTRLPGWHQILTIHSWMEVPNEAPNPETQWMSWDIGKTHAIAAHTGRSIGCPWKIHFHTHPRGTKPEPSKNDLAYWAANCPLGGGSSLAAIVTLSPLRITAYTLSPIAVGVIPQMELEAGHFFSWREKRFASLK